MTSVSWPLLWILPGITCQSTECFFPIITVRLTSVNRNKILDLITYTRRQEPMGSCQATSNYLSFLRPANRVKSIPPKQGAATGLFGLIFSCGSRNEPLFLPKKCLLDEGGEREKVSPPGQQIALYTISVIMDSTSPLEN